jgi:hypothetical protein
MGDLNSHGCEQTGTYLKKVFWPNLGVGSGFQILGIQAYACGLKTGPAYTLDQNPFFEIDSTFWGSRFVVPGDGPSCGL